MAAIGSFGLCTFFCTLPERRQRVQTRSVFGTPWTMARTVWRLGNQRRFVTLWAWLILCPHWEPLLQTSHTLAMITISLSRNAVFRPPGFFGPQRFPALGPGQTWRADSNAERHMSYKARENYHSGPVRGKFIHRGAA